MSTTNPAGFNNPVTTTNGGSGATTATNAFNALSPLTTKGDFVGYSGSTCAALAVGANTTALIADSTATNGISWSAPGSVTSAGLTSTTLTVTGSPVTTSGTMTINTPLSIYGNNMLINGQMSLALRGANNSASFAMTGSATQYTFDRWQASCGAATNITVSSVAGPTSGSNYAKIQRNASNAGTATIFFCQSLTRDMCIGAAGNVVSLQFHALCGANFSAASSNLTVTVYSGTGTSDISGINGAFTGSSSVISSTATLTTSDQLFTFSSSALGSTVTQLAVQFSFAGVGTAGANDWFEVNNVQLEISPVCTNYQYTNAWETFIACARFYQKSFVPGTAPVQNAGTSTGEYYWSSANAGALADPSIIFPFPVTMRVAPTITLYSPGLSSAQVYDATNSAGCTSSSALATTAQGVTFTCTGNALTTLNSKLCVHWTAEADVT